MRLLALFALTVLLAGMAYVRLAPMRASDWHVAPDPARRTGKPNEYLVVEGGDRATVLRPEPPAELISRIDLIALSEPRTIRLAGTPRDRFATYVQRSLLMGYPDAISVRAEPEGTGSRLTIWSRSRFGHGDLGVNRKRVERWLAKLDDPEI
ncbi:DUF1499 domain-containing protein [uncultured Jannaschia sp.]|uniref:DUF1499 domain-containing protein n=1 Tax=uncultured Jannaschia sp. TaxID=293347 RepID=UPI0026131230|nr:DUF1499 domain-containing protein [uncultured Jannaschia sp.]